MSGPLYDGPGPEWEGSTLRAQAVPQVQFRHGNVILKHSGSRLTKNKGREGREEPKPEKISERTKKKLNLM